jgi:hypothetical protein
LIIDDWRVAVSVLRFTLLTPVSWLLFSPYLLTPKRFTLSYSLKTISYQHSVLYIPNSQPPVKQNFSQADKKMQKNGPQAHARALSRHFCLNIAFFPEDP